MSDRGTGGYKPAAARSEEPGERISELERALHYQTAACRALEQLVEDKGRELRRLRESFNEKTRELSEKATLTHLVEAGGLAAAAPKILQTICENLEWDMGLLWRVDEGAKEIACLEAWTRPDYASHHAEFVAAMRRTAFRSNVSAPGRAWESRTAATVFDLAADPTCPRATIAAEAGIHSTCAFPITVEQRVVCVVELLSREWREPGAEFMRAFDQLSDQMGRLIHLQRAKEALHATELSVARHVQTSILPRTLQVEGLDIAARMLPADEVGGDYFDVLPHGQGCWIGIGDVTGHGLAAGLVMVMVQSAIAALSRAALDAAPSQLVRTLNAMLFDNIRTRLVGDDHVTLSLIRYHADGRILVAGAHEELVIWRRRTGRCELVPTPGTWVGVLPDITSSTVDTSHRLEVGDMMVLYTDGLTEAMNAEREQFSLERVCAIVEQHHGEAPEAIRDRLFDAVLAWTGKPIDDITVLVLRYKGVAAGLPRPRPAAKPAA